MDIKILLYKLMFPHAFYIRRFHCFYAQNTFLQFYKIVIDVLFVPNGHKKLSTKRQNQFTIFTTDVQYIEMNEHHFISTHAVTLSTLMHT